MHSNTRFLLTSCFPLQNFARIWGSLQNITAVHPAVSMSFLHCTGSNSQHGQASSRVPSCVSTTRPTFSSPSFWVACTTKPLICLQSICQSHVSLDRPICLQVCLQHTEKLLSSLLRGWMASTQTAAHTAVFWAADDLLIGV